MELRREAHHSRNTSTNSSKSDVKDEKMSSFSLQTAPTLSKKTGPGRRKVASLPSSPSCLVCSPVEVSMLPVSQVTSWIISISTGLGSSSTWHSTPICIANPVVCGLQGSTGATGADYDESIVGFPIQIVMDVTIMACWLHM